MSAWLPTSTTEWIAFHAVLVTAFFPGRLRAANDEFLGNLRNIPTRFLWVFSDGGLATLIGGIGMLGMWFLMFDVGALPGWVGYAGVIGFLASFVWSCFFPPPWR